MEDNDRRLAEMLWMQGIERWEEGDFSAGANLCTQGIELYEQIEALQEAAVRADYLAAQLVRIGAFRDALCYHDRSLVLEKRRGNMHGAAISWMNKGTVHLMIGNEEESLNCLREALSLFRAIGDPASEAQVFFNLGSNYVRMGDYATALINLEQAIDLAEPLGIDPILVHALSTCGAIYSNQGKHEQAAAHLERALQRLGSYSEEKYPDLITMQGSRDLELSILENLTAVYSREKEYSKAILYCRRALEKQRVAGDQEGVVRLARSLSLLYFELSEAYLETKETERAVEFAENAVQLFRQGFGSNADLARSLGQLARAYYLHGDINSALSTYEEALHTARFIPDPELHLRLKGNLGILYRDLNQYTRALKYSDEALQLAQQIGSKYDEANQLANLGLLFQRMNDRSAAFAYFQAALELQKEIGDAHGQAMQLGNIGQIALSLGNVEIAIQYHTQALELDVKLGARQSEAVELGNLGLAYFELEDYDQAANHLQRALEIVPALGDRVREALHMTNLGKVYFAQGKQTDALSTWNTAMELAEAVEDRHLIYGLCFYRGILNYHMGRTDDAYADLKASVDNLELVRRQITSEEAKFRFVNLGVSSIYSDLITLIHDRLKRNEEAYDYVRRAKSQAFVDRISHLDITPPTNVPSQLQEVERRLVRKYRTAEESLWQARSRSDRHLAWTELGETRREIEQVTSEIATFSPEYAAWRKPRTLSLDQVHTILDNQGIDITLVEFFVLSEKVLMFVTRTGDRGLHVLEAPISMNRLAYYLHTAIQNEIFEPPTLQLKETWQALANDLIQPLRPYLDGCELLCFAPHMHIHRFPLHALILDKRRLIELVPIAYLPNSRLLVNWQVRPERSSNGCLALGYTPYPMEKAIIEEEAARVAKLLGGKAYVGEQATCTIVRNEAKSYAFLHLSCHGHFDEIEISNSGLDLADGLLTVKDIVGLTLDAKMVVLSACQSGANVQTASDDLVGLTRSFFYAGTDSLIVSLWSVAGESTLQFMETFYGHLQAGHSKAVALQKAQLELMADDVHPHYWAPFVLIGDWR
jgi:CHAT domain-containing protein/Tfp pilus assembly protein PilF